MPFIETNGIRTFYRETGKKRGAPIIFLHGFSSSSREYTRITSILSDRYRCISYDLRGHGETEAPEEGYDLETMAIDLEALMDGLQVREALLVGHSLGGLILQEFITKRPEKARGLVIISSSTRLTEKHSTKIAGILAEKLVDKAKKDLPGVYKKTYGLVNKLLGREKTEDLEKIMIQFLATPEITLRKTLKNLVSYKPKKSLLWNYTGPVLVIIGEKDPFVSIEEAGETALAFPNSWMKIIKNGAHNILTPHAEEIAGAIREFYEWNVKKKKAS